MSNSTIANLTSGSPAQSTDVLPIQRSATTLKLAVSDIVALTVPVVNPQSGTTYTAALVDGNNIVTMSNSGASTFKIDTQANVAFPVGTVISVVQLGTGQVTLTALAGVTFLTASSLTTRVQYSTVLLTQVATNTWVVSGDLT